MANGVIIPNMSAESGTDSTTYGSIKWKKQGNLVCVEYHIGNISASEWRLLGTIPVGCRPSYDMYNASWADGTTGNTRCLMRPTGEVQVIGTSAADSSITYIV